MKESYETPLLASPNESHQQLAQNVADEAGTSEQSLLERTALLAVAGIKVPRTY